MPLIFAGIAMIMSGFLAPVGVILIIVGLIQRILISVTK